MRKHGWIRKKSMNYSQNVQDLDTAIADLQHCNFIRTRLEDLSEALNVLLADELRDLLKERNIPIPEGVSF